MSRRGFVHRARRALPAPLRRFLAAREGAITPFVLVMSLALFVIMGLVLDSARSYVAHTQMQDYIDDMAILAVSEMDGEPDAIARADKALSQSWLDKTSSIRMAGTDAFATEKVFYLTGQPRSSDRKLRYEDFSDLVTTDPAAATHVLVTSAERDVPWHVLDFLPSSGDDAGFTIGTWAAARLVEQACTDPLLAMCAPAGLDPDTLQPGQQVRLTKNRDATWSAGEYGVVTGIRDDADSTCGGRSGIARLECLLALDSHQTQCAAPRVSFRGDPPAMVTITDAAGNTRTVLRDSIDVHEAMNTRFGMIEGDAATYAATDAISIDTGHHAGEPYQCDGSRADTTSSAQGLPLAGCILDGTCTGFAPKATADELETYWTGTHGRPVPSGDVGGAVETRFDAYRQELLAGLLDPDGGTGQGPRTQCHPTGNSTKADRRVFQMALVDCSSMTGLTQTDVEPLAFVDVFLSDEVGNSDAFVADFNGQVPTSASSTHTMGTGDVVMPNVSLTGSTSYEPYAAQGMKIRVLADSTSTHSPRGEPCTVGEGFATPGAGTASVMAHCISYASKDFKLDTKADPDALADLLDLNAHDFTLVAKDEDTGGSSSFDAGGVGKTSGRWKSSTPHQLLVFKAANSFSVVMFDQPVYGGDWKSGDMRLVNNGGQIAALSNLASYEFKKTGKVPGTPTTTGSHKGYNVPVLVDTHNYSGSEGSTMRTVDSGNVVIIPGSTDTRDPVRNSRGGVVVFTFTEPTLVDSLDIFGGGATEIRVFEEEVLTGGIGTMTDSQQLEDLYPSPDVVIDATTIADGSRRTVNVTSSSEYQKALSDGDIGSGGIRTVIVKMADKGAIDAIRFTNSLTTPNRHDDVTVEFLNAIGDDDPRVSFYPELSN